MSEITCLPRLQELTSIREAVFFLVTNVLIVFGLVAFDNAVAILNTFPERFPNLNGLPSPMTLVQALLLPTSQYDQARIDGLKDALDRLQKKSRSFYFASGVFDGQLRIDMILLYSFCRVVDDLVDHAHTMDEARAWIDRVDKFLNLKYGSANFTDQSLRLWLQEQGFAPSACSAMLLLPTSKLSRQPLHDLLEGFRMDLDFGSKTNPFPIYDADQLDVYAMRVAGTVAESCIELVYHHSLDSSTKEERQNIIRAGGQMGIALQYVNIARDIAVDAHLRRVYLPTTWLKDTGLTPEDILTAPESPKVESLRQKLLDHAFALHDEAIGAIERLPLGARGPMRVAVECYMEIGRVLRTPGYKVKAGRATVPSMQRLKVAWKAMQA